MPKHPKRPSDPNKRAKLIVDMATGVLPKDKPLSKAQEAGRLGGLKGGKARAEKMAPAARKASAKKAAKARWEK